MKKGMLAIVLLVFPLAGCCATLDTQNQNTASLEEATKENVWDFGKVKAGEILKHDFVLKNETDKPITIKEVNTSCGCTASEAKKKNLAPGESTEINVAFDSSGYSGTVKQYVFVNTDSVDKPMVRFIIKADVVKE